VRDRGWTRQLVRVDPWPSLGSGATCSMALVLPSGYYKWDVEEIRAQLRELRRRRREADDQD
jgi:hypothetical protein